MSPTPQSAPHRQPSGPVAAPRQCLWPRRAQLAAAGPSANISPSGVQWQYGDSVTLSTGIIRMIDAATWLISLSCCQWPYPYAIKQLPDIKISDEKLSVESVQNRIASEVKLQRIQMWFAMKARWTLWTVQCAAAIRVKWSLICIY